MGAIRRACDWKSPKCPLGLTVSGPGLELDPLLFGFKIEKCTAGGVA
jgi:hypothetical protein